MPELPEVETIRRQLEREIIGKKIIDVRVKFARKLNVPPSQFIKRVRGAKFKAIRRRAKILILDLSNGASLLVHLKMTGRLLFKRKTGKPTKHTHIIFSLSGGNELSWEDFRKFGYIKLIETAKVEEYFKDEGFGPEPLSHKFTPKAFKKCLLNSPNKKIKPLLMDQKCVAGIGNIYADEALWYAGILPSRKAGQLSAIEAKKLFTSIRKSLRDSLNHKGTSADAYLDAYGKKGTHFFYLNAYAQEGKRCAKRDKGIIIKIRLGGRGTHYCPKHQK